MKRSMVGDLVRSPVVWWGASLLVTAVVASGAVYLVTGLGPAHYTGLWFAILLLAGLSVLVNVAPPFVVRAQARFENSRAAETYHDIELVFGEERLIPGVLSMVGARAVER